MESIEYLNDNEVKNSKSNDLEFCEYCKEFNNKFCNLKKFRIDYPNKPIKCFFYELEKNDKI